MDSPSAPRPSSPALQAGSKSALQSGSQSASSLSASGSASGSASQSTSRGRSERTLKFEGSVIAGKYQILSTLGQGGMGAVYEARHVATHRIVALKTITAPAATDDKTDDSRRDSLGRFSREARVIGQIRSEHVVEIYDAGVNDDANATPFIAMERLHGRDLHSIAKDCGPLPAETVIRVGIQAARGLAAAHDVGVVHRDIKPANLFLAEGAGGPIIKVVDFGVARVVSGSPVDLTQDLTRTGSLLGSPLYMSPEQVRGSHDVDARTDVWALAVTLYKLLSGRTPQMKDKGLGELLISICCEPAAPVTTFAPWVRRDLAKLLSRALTISPDERLESAAVFGAELQKLLDGAAPTLGLSDFRALTEGEKRVAFVDREAVEPTSVRSSVELHGESSSTNPAVQTNGRTRRVVPIAAAIAIAATLGSGAMFGLSKFGAPVAPVALVAVSTASAQTPQEATRVIEVHTMRLSVPGGAQIAVDGVEMPLDGDDAVVLRGSLGTSHRVRVSVGDRSVETRVVLSDRGPVPSRIDLPTERQSGPPIGSSPTQQLAPPIAQKGAPASNAPAVSAPATASTAKASRRGATPGAKGGGYADWE